MATWSWKPLRLTICGRSAATTAAMQQPRPPADALELLLGLAAPARHVLLALAAARDPFVGADVGTGLLVDRHLVRLDLLELDAPEQAGGTDEHDEDEQAEHQQVRVLG